MKLSTLIKSLVVGSALLQGAAIADEATGIITFILVPTNHNFIYFRIDPMPLGVTKDFYIKDGSGTSAGCAIAGTEKTTDRAYSALLTAKASSKTVTLKYCVESGGYGLVNNSVRVNQ